MSAIAVLVPALRSALVEAFDISSALLPASLRSQFVLVSRAALARYGAGRRTEDVDIACTEEAGFAFRNAMDEDSRFMVDPDYKIAYTAQCGPGEGIRIQIDLLLIGDEAVPALEFAPVSFGDSFVAALGDLVVLKARAWLAARDKAELDFQDFEWALSRIHDTDSPFNALLILQLLKS